MCERLVARVCLCVCVCVCVCLCLCVYVSVKGVASMSLYVLGQSVRSQAKVVLSMCDQIAGRMVYSD